MVSPKRVDCNIVVYENGKVVGNIIRESPDMFPEDWTLVLDKVKSEIVASLERCKMYAYSYHPKATFKE